MNDENRLTIGTRGSALALTQARAVAAMIGQRFPDINVDIQTLNTRGDATQAAGIPLSSFGEKGIFAKELEEALLAGSIDLAVHSMKDLAHTLPSGLCLAAVPAREVPNDVLVGNGLTGLPPGAKVGTGSVRRRALLRDMRPDLELLEIRGNVDTRLRKLDEGQYDAICLAAAGLRRLGLGDRITEMLDTSWFTPDPGQGALAIETRTDDARVLSIVGGINDVDAAAATSAERAFLAEVGGSCQTPVGALATIDSGRLTLSAMIEVDGRIRRAQASAPVGDAVGLGREVARRLLDNGTVYLNEVL